MPSIMAARLLVFLMLLGMAPTAIAEDGSVMRIDHSFTLMEYDPGIEDAAMHPASNWVVVVGAEGYAVSMDKSSPSTMIPLADISDSDLLDSDYHPGGNTALIVGENGSVLRYAISDHSIERATSAQSVGYDTMQAVSWNANGEWAYLGSSDGTLYRMRPAGNGSSEIVPMPGTGGSTISSIDCLPEPFVCLVASAEEGIGMIDRDHVLSWIGGSGSSWSDIVCRSGGVPVCIAISMDRSIAEIEFESGVVGLNMQTLEGFEGTPRSISLTSSEQILITATPAEIIEHRPLGGGTFTWLTNEAIVGQSFGVSGSTITGVWAGDSGDHWIMTRDGTVALLVPEEVGVAQGLPKLVTMLSFGIMGVMAIGIWSTRSSR